MSKILCLLIRKKSEILYRSRGSRGPSQGEQYISICFKILKNREKSNFFKKIISIQGVQGAIPEGPEPFPDLKNMRIIEIFKLFEILIFYFGPRGPFFALDPRVPIIRAVAPPVPRALESWLYIDICIYIYIYMYI